MVNNFREVLNDLPQLFKRKEWQVIKDIAHKLKGGASYCGALRLEQDCQKLINCLQMSSVKNAKAFYNGLIREMIAVKEKASAYISSK